MPRAPFQILVIPFHKNQNQIRYTIFRRSDNHHWQFIAGGGETSESPLQAAVRELHEEAAISPSTQLIALKSQADLPASIFSNTNWPANLKSIPEHTFAIDITNTPNITLSNEHSQYRSVDYQTALNLLYYPSNRTALRELDHLLIDC